MADCRFVKNIKGISIALVPRIFFQKRLKKILDEILKYDDKDLSYIKERVNYYNKQNSDFSKALKEDLEHEKIGKWPFKSTSYAFDAYKLSKYFDDDFLWIKKFADVRWNFKNPTVCKSRSLNEKISIIFF